MIVSLGVARFGRGSCGGGPPLGFSFGFGIRFCRGSGRGTPPLDEALAAARTEALQKLVQKAAVAAAAEVSLVC